MKVTLKIWRQRNPRSEGKFESHRLDSVSPDSSLLETIDALNDKLESQGREPFAFESDCREGICGACSMVVNGRPHGSVKGATTCQLYMREFEDGQTIVLEPWKAASFPIVKDLVVDRSAFDRIMQAGGYISVNTGSAPDANALPIEKDRVETAMDAAQCIGCGACVAACKNASAMLFVGAKVSHLALLPQGQPERRRRVAAMVKKMDEEGFGNCTNEAECEAHCPKEISVSNIARLNREFLLSQLLD